jgi:tetratricopeptide (TPR) repeat protein
MMIVIFVLLLLLIVLGMSLLLWKFKTGAERRIRELQAEINRLTPIAFARDFARLNQYQRRLGVLFIDNLPLSTHPTVKRGYEAGLKLAEQGIWDRAYQVWKEAKSSAQGNERAGLCFLCGGCLVIKGEFTEAEKEFNEAFQICRKAANQNGLIAVLFVLADLAREQGWTQQARKLLVRVIKNCKDIGNAEFIGKTLVRMAAISLADRRPREAIAYYRQALKQFETVSNFSLVSAQYRSIGDVYIQLGELDNARAAYEDGLHLARESHNRVGEAESLVAIGRVHRMQGDFKRALDVLDRALRIYQETNFIRGQAQVLHELARVHEKNNELDIAREFFEQSLLFARRIRDNGLMLNNLLALALNAMLHYNYDRAKMLIDEAINTSRQLKKIDAEIRVNLILARFQVLQGKVEEAVVILNEVLRLSREINDRRHEAQALLGLVHALRLTGRIRDAEKKMKQFWNIFQMVPEVELQADAWIEEGLICVLKNELKAAHDFLKRAYDLHSKLGVKRAMAADLFHIGEIMFQSRQFNSAKSTLQEAIGTAEAAGAVEIQARALSLLGDVLYSLKERGSIESYNRALDLFRNIDDLRGEADSLKKLGKLFCENGVWDNARTHLEQALRIYQRLNDLNGIEEVKGIMNKLPATEFGLKLTF